MQIVSLWSRMLAELWSNSMGVHGSLDIRWSHVILDIFLWAEVERIRCLNERKSRKPTQSSQVISNSRLLSRPR